MDAATSQNSSDFLNPIPQHRGSTSYPQVLISNAFCLTPSTTSQHSCMFADIVTVNWCHAMMWEILHSINCCVTPFNKNVLSLMFLEATAQFPAVWSLAWGSLRARRAQCGVEVAISVHCVVEESREGWAIYEYTPEQWAYTRELECK